MILRRNSGVNFICSWVLLFFVVFWFGANVVFGVEVLKTINYSQTHYGIYFLGVFLAQIVRMGGQSEESFIKTSSSRWLQAINNSNKDVLFQLTVVFAIVFATKDKGISRVFLSTYLLTLWPSVLIMHRFFPLFLSGFLFGKTQRFRTLIIGSSEKVRELDSFIRDLPKSGLKVIGLVSIDEMELASSDLNMEIIGHLSELETLLDEHSIDQVIVVESGKTKDWFNIIFNTCDHFGCHVMVYNFWQDYFDQPIHYTRHGVHTFFTLQDEPLQNPINRILKRTLDLAISIPIVFGLLPILCLWVKIMQAKQAPGPIFFVQYRTGFQKERFKIFKFRSMYSEDDRKNEANQATAGDNRVYPFGALMRRRSIDEFPQFINVLKGEMSVIGPRPHLIKHDSTFSKTVGTYRIRHFVKPGLTGLAQVNGLRGEITDERLIQERVKMDIAYINSWSAKLDFEIIFKTISELTNPSDHAY